QVVGNPQIPQVSRCIPPPGHHGAGAGGPDLCGPGPAHQRLVVNAQGHGVQTAQLAVVPPDHGAVRLQEGAAVRENVHLEEGAEDLLAEQPLYGFVPGEGEGTGDDHGGEFGAGLGGLQ
ncbi:hypothetical protein RZS08_36995, partial [Arthrospira platensis SPKY1]|nr:hypothetical protein [Arthrospira platensis SPKY1]